MDEVRGEVEHSKFGVASFLIGIGIFISCALLVWIGVRLMRKDKITEFENNFMTLAVYFVLLFAPAAHLIGLILGGVGCLRNKGRKALAIAGFFINLVFLFIHFGIRVSFSGWFGR
jgi:hypothetical protein